MTQTADRWTYSRGGSNILPAAKVHSSVSASNASTIAFSPTPQNVDIVFINELPKELQCPICSQVLRSPMKLKCGHYACAICLTELSSDECPACGQPTDKNDAKKDRQIHRVIQKLPIKCTFSDNGCIWTGVLKDLQHHIFTCKYIDVECPQGCGEIYAKINEAHHLNDECGRRTKTCEFCKKEIIIKGIDLHLKICPAVIIDCPNRCGVCELTREQMSKHLVGCPNAGSSCPFSEFGCQYKGDRETLQSHIREQPIRHLTLLCDGVLDLKMLLANMESSLETMTHNMELLRKKIVTIEKLYGAQIIWRIDDVKQKQNEARSGTRTIIFSPPFATARYGYKMILSVSLYGDGEVRGEYMSAFVSIMRGEYDALLEWPFTHKVTITLMDQNPELDARNHIEYVIQPTPIPAHKPFLDRPISERNASFGAVRFCELSIVERYIHDDVMFLKVNVDNCRGLM